MACSEKRCLLIVGMHRSGTSMLAHLMVKLGYDIGKNRLRPGPGNPSGFFENKPIMIFNDKLLRSMNTTWRDSCHIEPELLRSRISDVISSELVSILEDQFSGQARCLVKDPRMCRLMPFWTAILGTIGIKKIRCLLPIRHPMNVARSLQARDKFTVPRGLLLWIQNVLAAERDTREHVRMVTIYDDVLSGISVSALAGFLEVSESLLMASIKQVANPVLCHQFNLDSNQSDLSDIEELALRIWVSLSGSAYSDALDEEALDAFWQDYLRVHKSWEARSI